MYNYTDLHLHTTHSWDAEQSIEVLIKKAYKEDIQFLGLTEHLDFHNNHPQSYMYLDYDKYSKAVDEAKKDFPGLIKGVEVGEPNIYTELYDRYMDGKAFDFIMASVHWIDGATPVFEEYFKRYKTYDDAYKKYFEEIYKLVSYGKFDAVAHLTLVHRQGNRLYKEYSYEKYQKEIDDILKVIIKNKLALEVNCSGLRHPARELIPDENVIKAYIKMGGNSIFIGSDSHTLRDSFYGLKQGYEMLDKLQVKEIVIFENRKQIRMPLKKDIVE
ncbi:MAG: histidinol-phosphatase HisJ family protein [bacterium]